MKNNDNVRNEFLKFSDTRLTLIRFEDRFLEGVLTLIFLELFEEEEEVFTISVRVLLLFEEVTVLVSDMFVSLISSRFFKILKSPR